MGTQARNATTALQHVLEHILKDESYSSAFENGGVTTITDFMELTTEDLASMTLSLMQCKHCLKLQEWCYSNELPDLNSWFNLTETIFELWRSNNMVFSPILTTSSPTLTTESPADTFKKIFNRSVGDYQPLKDAKHWHVWNREFVATAKTHGIEKILIMSILLSHLKMWRFLMSYSILATRFCWKQSRPVKEEQLLENMMLWVMPKLLILPYVLSMHKVWLLD